MIFLYYIQEADKLSWLSKTFNIIKLDNDKIILPIKADEISEKKAQKMARRTKKILDKTNSKKMVISKNIKKYSNYINYLYTYQYEIVDGRWLFEILSAKALDFITSKNDIKKEETQVSILVNDLTESTLENIKIIVKQYKRVNIITNHIDRFKKIEQQIFEEEGIMITITNNKKKSLTKAKLILNVDFPSELINKYNINEDAIIVNLKGNVKINKKRFNGLNINDYEIKFESQEKFEYDKINKYKMAEIYEANIYKRAPFKNIVENLEKDKVEILMLQGNNLQLY